MHGPTLIACLRYAFFSSVSFTSVATPNYIPVSMTATPSMRLRRVAYAPSRNTLSPPVPSCPVFSSLDQGYFSALHVTINSSQAVKKTESVECTRLGEEGTMCRWRIVSVNLMAARAHRYAGVCHSDRLRKQHYERRLRPQNTEISPRGGGKWPLEGKNIQRNEHSTRCEFRWSKRS